MKTTKKVIALSAFKRYTIPKSIFEVLFNVLYNLSSHSSKLFFASSVCRKLFDGGNWNLLDGGGKQGLK